MTSAKDFHIISWKNGLGLSGIVVAVLVPVGLRYFWRDELKLAAETELSDEDREVLEGVVVESGGPPAIKGKGKNTVLFLDEDEVLEDAIPSR